MRNRGAQLAPALVRVGAAFGVAICIALSGCSSRAAQQPSTGIAYAGPANLNLRKDLAPKAPVVGTAHHGDRLEVIDSRRRFIKVRTAQGVEGWTDSNLLLTEQHMADLRRLAESAAKLPSQGSATVYDVLNMHTEPRRQSPSFFQIPEGGTVEVIGHQLTQHGGSPPAPRAAPVVRKSAPPKKKGKDGKPVIDPPPMPTPPKPPENWVELSRPRRSDLPGARPVPAAAPPVFDDWSLVRMRDGKVGWALTRMLTMTIPDEVAQHAEGHRITAYVALGEVKDKARNETKHNWLWTTAASSVRQYEFDSFRVFVYSTRHRRYETAYIERNVRGYYPVETQDIPGQEAKAFSLVLEGKDGKLYKNVYAFSGYHVRMISKTPYEPPPALPQVRASTNFEATPAPPSSEGGWWRNMRRRVFGN